MAKIKEILPEGFKRCSKCGEVKMVEEFIKSKSRKDGLFSYCKLCNRMLKKDNYVKNKTHVLENNKDWYYKNRDTCLRLASKWAKNNPDKRAIYNKKFRESDYGKLYIENNRDKQVKYATDGRKKLADWYIRNELKYKGFPSTYITPELIEAKRLIIKSKRVVKSIKNN